MTPCYGEVRTGPGPTMATVKAGKALGGPKGGSKCLLKAGEKEEVLSPPATWVSWDPLQ